MSNDWIMCYILFSVVILLICALSFCAARAGVELNRFYNELLREWGSKHD